MLFDLPDTKRIILAISVIVVLIIMAVVPACFLDWRRLIIGVPSLVLGCYRFAGYKPSAFQAIAHFWVCSVIWTAFMFPEYRDVAIFASVTLTIVESLVFLLDRS